MNEVIAEHTHILTIDDEEKNGVSTVLFSFSIIVRMAFIVNESS